MPFTHNPVTIPYLTRETIDGVRWYTAPNSDGKPIKLVSITSVTSYMSREGILQWRKRVGDKEANRISKLATDRGSSMHLLTEHYLKNEKLPEDQIPISEILFKIAKPALNDIDNIIVQEQAMYSLSHGIAGTPDCIADYKGELSIIDFKTSKAAKPLKWIEGYFVQAYAYACMLFELTGIEAKKLVIIMACEDGELKVYEEKDLHKWSIYLQEYIEKFVNEKLETYDY